MSDVIRRDDLVMGPREKAIAAVEAGDKEEALKQIEALHMLFKPLHRLTRAHSPLSCAMDK